MRDRSPNSSLGGRFAGFDSGSQKAVPVPEQFFNELLPSIDSLDELKLALALVHLSLDKWNRSPSFTLADLEEEPLIRIISQNAAESESLSQTLGRLLRRGVVIDVTAPAESEMHFALNSERGRKVLDAESGGDYRRLRNSDGSQHGTRSTNIFSLYEDAIGTISPLLADELRQAEKLYPPEWIEEAFVLAAKYNKRSWRYVQAMLERWALDGR